MPRTPRTSPTAPGGLTFGVIRSENLGWGPAPVRVAPALAVADVHAEVSGEGHAEVSGEGQFEYDDERSCRSAPAAGVRTERVPCTDWSAPTR